MVGDEKLNLAVSRVLQRSERQEDVQKLIGTFVDLGILAQLENRNNQIVYGRRGTGKTHVFRVLGTRFAADPKSTVVYIDARTLGSSSQFSDSSLPMSHRCLALFRDVLTLIHDALLEHVIEQPSGSASEALAACDRLAGIATEAVQRVVPETLTSSAKEATELRSDTGVSLSAKPSISTSEKQAEQQEVAQSATYRVASEDKIVFPALHSALSDVLKLGDTTLVLLFDEWSSLPLDVQPYLAEFFKRGILPLANAILKIASLEYRSRFMLGSGDQYVGFELGADISAAQDIDDYFVFDRNPDAITNSYADVLYRHLAADLPENYLAEGARRRQWRGTPITVVHREVDVSRTSARL